MARKFIDGFEAGTSPSDLWDANSGATTVSSAGLDMDGDYCLDLNYMQEYISKDITADDEMYFAFLWRPTHTTNSEEMLGVFAGATSLIHIACNTGLASSIKAYLGSGTGTVLATGTKTFTVNTTYLIEIRIKIADSGGRVEVKVDGIQDIDFTGDTKVGADTQFNKVRLGYCDNVGVYVYAYFDNFIMDDAAWIGDTKIQAILPTGAGTTTGWTPSAGSNYACVDERPASDADYVSIDAVDTVDTYAAGDMTGTISSVKCVQVQSRSETDGAPTPTNLQLAVRSGGTDYFSSSHAVPAGPAGLCNLWENNPADAAAWVEADVNAVEIGIKSIA